VYRVSVRRACRLVEIDKSTFYYGSVKDNQTWLRMKIRDYTSAPESVNIDVVVL